MKYRGDPADRLAITSDHTKARKNGSVTAGIRFKINELGALQCPPLANKTGVVIEVSTRSTGVTVLLDGATRPTCIFQGYICPLSR
ncbi:hypothetical protein ACWAT4_09585 [Bradyrhizobium manausense]